VELVFEVGRRTPNRLLVLAAVLCLPGSSWAQAVSPCDLNRDGVVNAADVTLAVNMALGVVPCTASVEGPHTCTVVTVQRVINASMGQACITYGGHAVTLNWVASTSPNVAGYNVYRVSTSGGPYTTRVNSTLVTGTTYADTVVQAGQTYYYVVTAVDASGNESGYSNQTTAVVPNP